MSEAVREVSALEVAYVRAVERLNAAAAAARDGLALRLNHFGLTEEQRIGCLKDLLHRLNAGEKAMVDKVTEPPPRRAAPRQWLGRLGWTRQRSIRAAL